jgi:hypothetical protein
MRVIMPCLVCKALQLIYHSLDGFPPPPDGAAYVLQVRRGRVAGGGRGYHVMACMVSQARLTVAVVPARLQARYRGWRARVAYRRQVAHIAWEKETFEQRTRAAIRLQRVRRLRTVAQERKKAGNEGLGHTIINL